MILKGNRSYTFCDRIHFHNNFANYTTCSSKNLNLDFVSDDSETVPLLCVVALSHTKSERLRIYFKNCLNREEK
jgi:hypothetical protein